MNPLKISCLLLMSVVTIFFLLLIAVAMVRVLTAPLQKSEPVHDVLSVDVLVTDVMEVTPYNISKNQNTVLVCGMSVLISQNTEEDGLYLLDSSKELIRVDCVKQDLTYHINSGKHQGLSFKPCAQKIIQDQVISHVISKNASVSIDKHTAQVVLFLEKDVTDVLIQFVDVHCFVIVSNNCKHSVNIASEFQTKTLCLSPGTHQLFVIENEIKCSI